MPDQCSRGAWSTEANYLSIRVQKSIKQIRSTFFKQRLFFVNEPSAGGATVTWEACRVLSGKSRNSIWPKALLGVIEGWKTLVQPVAETHTSPSVSRIQSHSYTQMHVCTLTSYSHRCGDTRTHTHAQTTSGLRKTINWTIIGRCSNSSCAQLHKTPEVIRRPGQSHQGKGSEAKTQEAVCWFLLFVHFRFCFYGLIDFFSCRDILTCHRRKRL